MVCLFLFLVSRATVTTNALVRGLGFCLLMLFFPCQFGQNKQSEMLLKQPLSLGAAQPQGHCNRRDSRSSCPSLPPFSTHHARFLQQVQGTYFNPLLISEKLVMYLNQQDLCLWLNTCSTETGPTQIVTAQMQVVDADFFPSL